MSIITKYRQKYKLIFIWLVFPICCMMPSKIIFAQDSECAQVKIKIEQKLSFERQAFDARMIINNGLTDSILENLRVALLFTDKNNQSVVVTQDSKDNNDNALFFYRVNSLSGINSIDGNGIVDRKSNAEIHWLIIPAYGSAKNDNTLYYIGAKVTYTLNGQETTIEVTPDYVVVKPLPLLTVDYFLPNEVYGDDPFTPENEQSIPFSLGIRVKNEGQGISYNTTIDSAKLKIVDNKQNLLIDFKMLGSYINDQASNESLLLNFGDIPGNTSKIGRLDMMTSLSGKFEEFEATFTHADTLGGSVTSLLKTVKTHTLIHNVKVDLPESDNITDFLALDGEEIRVYESEGINTEVKDQSLNTVFNKENKKTKLVFPKTDGLVYVKVADPHLGKVELKKITRSDGKILSPENFWQSKTRNEDLTWSYFIHLFDSNSTGSYDVYEENKDEIKPLVYTISVVKGVRYSLSNLLPENYYFEANKSYKIEFKNDDVTHRACSKKKNFNPKTKKCKSKLETNYTFSSDIFIPLKSGFLHNDNTLIGKFYLYANKNSIIKASIIPLKK